MTRYGMHQYSYYSSGGYARGGRTWPVVTPYGTYLFSNEHSGRIIWNKTTDNGLTWERGIVHAGSAGAAVHVWYDGWSGLGTGLIHLGYIDSTVDDLFYRNLDPSTDTLSTEITVFNGASATTGGDVTISVSRGGVIYMLGTMDLILETWAKRSDDGGATFTDITNPVEAAYDQYQLVPGFAADDDDMMLIYFDTTDTEISRMNYDQSADSWDETSIFTSWIEDRLTNGGPHWQIALDLANSKIYLIAWNQEDVANQDLLCWEIDDTTITAKTNLITNAVDDMALAALTFDTTTEFLYAFFVGAEDGSETYKAITGVNINMKVSEDQGTTWGPLIAVTEARLDFRNLASSPMTDNFWKDFPLAVMETINNNQCNYKFFKRNFVPKPQFQLGI